MKEIEKDKICLNVFEYLNLPNERGEVSPVIFAWYRDPKTLERKKLVFKGFDPYFYVDAFVKVPTYFYNKSTGKKTLLVKKEELVPRTSFHPLLKKVTTYLPHFVRQLRKILESHNYSDHIYEADIEFIYRFLIDKQIKFGLKRVKNGFQPLDEDIPSNLRIIFLDIEIFSKRKPNPKKLRKAERIICCTVWDNYTNTYYLFYEYSHPLNVDFGKDVKIIYCKNERILLLKLTKFIAKLDPDVIAGFNIDWDLTAIIKTMEQRHLLNPDILSPLKKVSVRAGKKKLRDIIFSTSRVRIYGRSILDLLELYLKIHLSGLDEMSLEHIAEIENLPVQKVKVPDFYETWVKNPKLILKRNLLDVKIYVELNKKLDLINFADEQRRLVGCKLEDTISPKKMLDLYLLRMKGKRILPTARQRGGKYPGAYVHVPKEGLYSWIIQLDFSHLYPSIMMCFNIDPEVFRNPKQWKGTSVYNKLYILDENHGFLKEPKGLIPQMLTSLLELRQKKKKLQKEALARKDEKAYKKYLLQEGGVKVLANALYGVMGYRFRKGSLQTIESVTLVGRMLMKFVIDEVEKTGRMVLYGDTDSIFVKAKNNNLEDCLREAKEIQSLIHSKLKDFLAKFGKVNEQPFYLAPERIYSSFFILSKKKRYAGYVEWDIKRGKNIKNRFYIKGLETRRSDVSSFGRRIQNAIIFQILERKPKEKIIEYLEKVLNQFDKLSLLEIGIPSAIGQPLKAYKANSIQKQSAEYSNKYLGTYFDVGSKPKRFYIKKVPEHLPFTHSLAWDKDKLPEGFEIDYPKMLEVTVKKKIEKLLNLLGIEWNEVKLKENLRIPEKKKKKRRAKDNGKKGQKRLFEFFT